MKELKQDGPIREYVKEFSNLMLQIPNMSDDDFFFNFMDGLKLWATQELKRHDVKGVSTAMTVAETLVEYCSSEKELFKPTSNHVSGNEVDEKGEQEEEATIGALQLLNSL